MNIKLPHHTTKENAIKKIDSVLDNLMKAELPAGVQLKKPQKSWSGNKMDFSFKAAKGMLLSVSISGTVTVSETDVEMVSDLPDIVKTLMSEEQIKAVIVQEFKKLFPG